MINPFIVAHRGNVQGYPEITLSAFASVIGRRTDAIETSEINSKEYHRAY